MHDQQQDKSGFNFDYLVPGLPLFNQLAYDLVEFIIRISQATMRLVREIRVASDKRHRLEARSETRRKVV